MCSSEPHSCSSKAHSCSPSLDGGEGWIECEFVLKHIEPHSCWSDVHSCPRCARAAFVLGAMHSRPHVLGRMCSSEPHSSPKSPIPPPVCPSNLIQVSRYRRDDAQRLAYLCAGERRRTEMLLRECPFLASTT